MGYTQSRLDGRVGRALEHLEKKIVKRWSEDRTWVTKKKTFFVVWPMSRVDRTPENKIISHPTVPLPDENKLFRIPNKDKFFHETWHPGRNLLNIPHPFRAILAGPPNRGKSTICKNLLLRADPPFEQVIVVHYDMETKEYDDLKGEHFFSWMKSRTSLNSAARKRRLSFSTIYPSSNCASLNKYYWIDFTVIWVLIKI